MNKHNLVYCEIISRRQKKKGGGMLKIKIFILIKC